MALGGIKVGDKVACIANGAEPWWKRIGRRWPKVARVYEVEGLAWCESNELSLKLIGLNPGRGKSWKARFFRKVQPRDLDTWLAAGKTAEGPVRKRRKATA
jgi:hypothetical protein